VIVDAQDAAFFFGGKTTLTFNISPKQAKIGDTIQLTVHRIGTNQQFGLEPFIITAHSQGIVRTWWVVVGDP